MPIRKTTLLMALTIVLAGCSLMMYGYPGTTQAPGSQQAGSIRDPNSVMWRFSSGFMSSKDLPPGWGHRRAVDEDDLGGLGRVVIYFGDDPVRMSLVSVNQTIVIYASEAEASAAFRSQVPKTIPPDHAGEWKRPTGLSAPRQADETEWGCLSLRINGAPSQTCSVLARYGDMLMILNGQVFEDRWMTMPQFTHLVERIDAHMQSARQP
jgi:hypothetical protein